jgi:ABC-type dipeptide/oligopeptide/nickel transport system ATPase component
LERPTGCPFHPRCPEVIPGRCDVAMPTVTRVSEGHGVSCLLYER